MLGQSLAYAPNMNAALLSAGRLFKILDRVPKYASANGAHSSMVIYNVILISPSMALQN